MNPSFAFSLFSYYTLHSSKLMKLQLIYSLTIFWLAFVASHAAISPEVYWKVKLPDTQIPKGIKDSLPIAENEINELKQGNTDTKEKVHYGLHKPYGYDRAATEDEVRELKQDNTANKEKVYHGLHKPYGYDRAATEDEVRELKQDNTVTKEKVYYGLHKPYGYDRAATEDEVHELKQDNTATKEKVYYGLHKPYGYDRVATKDEVREIKQDNTVTKEKIYYGLHKPYGYDRAATEDEVRELKQDNIATKEKVYYGLHKPYGYDRAATEDEVRELKQDNTANKEKVYYGLHKPYGYDRAATKNEVRELKQDTTANKEKVYYGLHIPYGYDRAATGDEVHELKQDNTATKERVYYGLHKPYGYDRAAAEDEVRHLKRESHYMHHATSMNDLQQVNEGSSSKSDPKDDFLYKPYFLEKNLEKGKVINFPSLKNKNEAPFLSRQFVESIPFSLEKVAEILNHFSIDSSSKDAQTIEETIRHCEEPAMKGEKKRCATSLESMVDISLTMLGTNNVVAVTTEVEGETQMLQKYTIEEVQEIAEGDNLVCHKLSYAYAVYNCHIGGPTKIFMVSMIGADGTKVKAVSVCHKDTSFWNPKGLPFVLLKVKPGTTPICHFLQDDQIAFLPSKHAIKLSDN